MSKIVAQQIPSEQADFSIYFDDDCLTSACGEEKYAIYIPAIDQHHFGFNSEEYLPIVQKASNLIEDIDYMEAQGENAEKMKEFISDCYPTVSSENVANLLAWARTSDAGEANDMAVFLSLTTGRNYDAKSFSGYSQGEYCEVLYCTEAYSDESINEIGKMWLGCGTEYSIDNCRGYFVTDDVQWAGGEMLVNKLAENYGCEPSDLDVEVIKSEHIRTEVEYECITEQESTEKEIEPISTTDAYVTAQTIASDVCTIEAFFEQSSKGGKSAPTLSDGDNKSRILADIDCAIEDLQTLKMAIESDKVLGKDKLKMKDAVER